MILSGESRIAGVVGWPVGHSRSPRLHGFWLEKYGIDGAYIPLPVAPEHFALAAEALPKLGFRGFNVTLPHKTAALDACAGLDDAARRIGAVNTVVIGEDGSLHGSNTDAYGFIEALRAELPGFDGSGCCAAILGAGGAARAVAIAVADLGFAEIRLVNRTVANAERMARELRIECAVYPWSRAAAALDGCALLVNTTSLGMAGQPDLNMDIEPLPREAAVVDIVYTPLRTELLAAAARRGNPVVDGLGMLLHQARPGFKAWFGGDPEVTPELRAFVAEGL